MEPAEYLRQSIVEPDARIAEGFQGGVMPDTYERTLTEEQLDALVQYLLEGEGQG